MRNRLFGFALLLTIVQFFVLQASAQQFQYRGHDSTYPNINMQLTLTRTGATYDATGTIYVGNFGYVVKGTLSGSALSGIAATSANFGGPAYRAAVNGVLSGNLGSGTLTVNTGGMVFNNGYPLALHFVLSPNGPQIYIPPPPPPPPSPQPAQLHLTGSTGFGYTRVTLNLNLTLRGSVYDVRGTIFVNQIQPTVIQQTLGVSGTLTPGVQGALTVFGAPAGNSPSFIATLGPRGAPLQGLLGGMPSFGITRLFIGAQ